jgi:prephenate dehydrogenase
MCVLLCVHAAGALHNASLISSFVTCSYIHADAEALLRMPVDVVILSVSILSFMSVLQKLPLELMRGKLVVDVLSVKSHPKESMLRVLTPECDILCTHPMFGPQSGKTSWVGLPLMYEKVSVGHQLLYTLSVCHLPR